MFQQDTPPFLSLLPAALRWNVCWSTLEVRTQLMNKTTCNDVTEATGFTKLPFSTSLEKLTQSNIKYTLQIGIQSVMEKVCVVSSKFNISESRWGIDHWPHYALAKQCSKIAIPCMYVCTNDNIKTRLCMAAGQAPRQMVLEQQWIFLVSEMKRLGGSVIFTPHLTPGQQPPDREPDKQN